MEEYSGYYILLAYIKPLTLGVTVALFFVAILLVVSALVSGSEVAFFSLLPKHLEKIKKSKKGSVTRIDKLLGRPNYLLATILISNNFINVGIVILSSYLYTQLFDFGDHNLLGFLVQVVGITFLILLFGEVVPKVYATKHPLRLSKLMSGPVTILQKVFYPLSTALIGATSFINQRVQKRGGEISMDDLSHALELTDNDDVGKEEQKILKEIVRFGNTDVKQVMTPRLDVFALDKEMQYSNVFESIVKSGYSRIPVYSGDLDTIEGVLYVKDLIPHINKTASFKWGKLIRPPFFVPENKKIDDLLKEFQEKKVHLAVVVDEYGGSSGIITLEDVIEEIVGDISDEFDDDSISYSKLDDHNYIFEGKTPLNDLYKILSIDGQEFEDQKGDSDSLAGFILELTGRIPKKNERIEFNEFSFAIEAADKKRLKQIKVTIKPKKVDE